MGFFTALQKVAKATVDVVVTPVEVVKDIATMGGLLTDENEPYTVQRLKKAKENLEDSYDELDR